MKELEEAQGYNIDNQWQRNTSKNREMAQVRTFRTREEQFKEDRIEIQRVVKEENY